MEVHINYIAVVLAMLSSMVVGSTWYAQNGFGNIWAKLAKIDLKKKNGSIAKPIITTMVVSLVTAYVLAHVTFISHTFFQYSFIHAALTTGFWIWLGFIASRFITHDAFEGRPARLTLINIGNEFLTIMIMALIIGFMGV